MQLFRSIVLLLASYFLINTAFATTYNVLNQGVGLEYELPPKNPQVFVNFMFAPVKATCTITSASIDNLLEITMLKKSGVLNDAKVKQGDIIELFIQNGDTFVFTIESGAKIQLLNKGEEHIKANCSAAS